MLAGGAVVMTVGRSALPILISAMMSGCSGRTLAGTTGRSSVPFRISERRFVSIGWGSETITEVRVLEPSCGAGIGGGGGGGG